MHRHRNAIAGWSIVLVVIAGLLYLVYGVMGIRTYYINESSMVPNLPVGTVVVDRPGYDPKAGEIVTFHNPDKHAKEGLTTHVFAGYTKDGHLSTVGVANPTADNFNPAPTRADIKGIVMFQIPIFAPAYWMSLRGMALGLLLLGLLFMLWTENKPRPATVSKEEAPGTAPTPV